MKILLDRGYLQKEIARRLRKAPSAISYELKTFTRKARSYDPDYAQLRSYQKRRNSKHQGQKIVSHRELQKKVDEFLKDDQSPEMIAGHIRKHCKDLPNISARAIRKYLASPYGRKIEVYRARLKKRYRRGRSQKPFMEGKRMITKRPQYINTRKRIGDAEGDFIVSGKSGEGIILNITDRKSRAPFLEKIHPVSVRNMENAVKRIKKRFPELTTLTLDNDILFIHYKKLEQKFKIKIFFCHKGSPWEKGTNENRNQLMRKFISKGSDISKISRTAIRNLEEKLQRKIMKCLNHQSPKTILKNHRNRKKNR